MVLSKCRQDYDTVINRGKEVSKVKLSGTDTKRVAESHLKTSAPSNARLTVNIFAFRHVFLLKNPPFRIG